MFEKETLFHSDYCIWSSWSALETKVFFPVLIHCVRDSVSCQLQSSACHCPVRKVCPDYCQHPLGWLLMLHLQIHIAYTQAPFLLSLLCDFVWLPTVNWDSNSSWLLTSIGVLENSQWPNKLNQFSLWTRYSGWNVKKSEDTILGSVCMGLCNQLHTEGHANMGWVERSRVWWLLRGSHRK